jgi:hypothetical protein
MKMTDFRALCTELTENLERYQCWYIEDNGYSLHELEALLRRADAALAQPEPDGPSDEELDLVVIAIQALIPPQPDATTHHLSAVDRGREILRQRLARWGNPQGT